MQYLFLGIFIAFIYCKPCDRQRSNPWHQQHPGVNKLRNYYRDHPEKWKAYKEKLAADPVRLEKRRKRHREAKRRKFAEARQNGLRVSRKVE